MTRIPNTAAGSGIANSTPDLGIEPIFYTRSSYWPAGRRERKKNFPRRDFRLNRISETKQTNELLQQNRALIFFFLRIALPKPSALTPTFLAPPSLSLRRYVGQP